MTFHYLDEHGESTLDSMLMDGPGHKYGAVASLRYINLNFNYFRCFRRVKSASRVAWAVMNYTEHSLLVGEKGNFREIFLK